MSRLCKNCHQKCSSIYCSNECNRTYKLKTKWITNKCLTCGKEIISRVSRPKSFCSNKCVSNNKTINSKKILTCKKTCLEKYGVENVMFFPENVEKIKKKMLEKYGVSSFLSTKNFREKSKATMLKRYGVEYAQQSDNIKSKTREVVMKKYGGFTLASPILSNKAKNTMMEKYGVINPLQSNKIKEKQQKTNIERYGSITPLTDRKIKEKTSITLEKYGVKNISQLPKIQQTIRDTCRQIFIEYLFGGNRLENKVTPLFKKEDFISTSYKNTYPFRCNTCKLTFEDDLYSGHIPRCPTCFPKTNSTQQTEIREVINQIIPGEKIMENKRSILPSGKELDIYIPSLKIAIEYDGLYWHSEITGGKPKQYHLNKTVECEKSNIHLLHIFENEWENKKDIIKNKLSHLLNKTPHSSISARKCEVKELSTKEKNEFLDLYHIQGKDNSSVRLGALYKGKLVSVMTFGKRRVAMGAKNITNDEYEMYRFCVGKDRVVGVGGKLFSHFIRNYNPCKITTYADRRYSTSSAFYTQIGMSLVGETSPNYWYFLPHEMKLYHRFCFRKTELIKKLKIYDPNLTEWQNMQLNGYDRIWDCGHYKYEWIRS